MNQSAVPPASGDLEQAEPIAAPDGRRDPLKVNVFEAMTGAACALLPLFPYLDAGAIVPCGVILRGDPKTDFGQFFHYNTAEEVNVVYGSNNAMLATGQIYASQNLHGVNSFLRDPEDPDAFVLVTVTQHQAEARDQTEAVIFRCAKCHNQLLRFEYDATPPGSPQADAERFGQAADDRLPMFATLWGGTEAVAEFESDQARTCKECGHVNERYPIETWGWRRYVAQLRTANDSRRALDSAAAAAGV